MGVVKADYQPSDGPVGPVSDKEKAPRNGGAEVYGDMKKGPTG
jgi:hypothetical protein